MNNPTKTDIKKRAFLEALEKTLGVVTTACKMAEINRSTYYDWIEKDPEFKKRVMDIGEIALDFAESSLHKQIKRGNTIATIFYLKTKGKKRGYIERIEQKLMGELVIGEPKKETFRLPPIDPE